MSLSDLVEVAAVSRRRGWMRLAKCAGQTDLFYATDDESRARAQGICRHCPVQRTCLDWALENREMDGIWGGMTEAERARVNRTRGAAKAPKRRCKEVGCMEPSFKSGLCFRAYMRMVGLDVTVPARWQPGGDGYGQDGKEEEL